MTEDPSLPPLGPTPLRISSQPLSREDGEGSQNAQLEIPRFAQDDGGTRSSAASRRRIKSGFTIAELITVVAIVGILASVAMPIASFGIRRQKEIELRERLRRLTSAIDQYHDLRLQPPGNPTSMKKPPDFGQGNYPKDLEELTKPIELNNGNYVRLLRERDLIDPMTGKSDWIRLGVNDDPDKSDSNTEQVFEVHSSSTALALDGKTHYNEW